MGAPNPNTLSLRAFDATGALIVEIGTLTTRSADDMSAATARSAHLASLFAIDWVQIPPPADVFNEAIAFLGDAPPRGALESTQYPDLGSLTASIEAGAQPPDVVITCVPDPGLTVEGAHAAVRSTLKLLQDWLSVPRLTDSRLVILSEGAVAVSAAAVLNPAQAAVWGLMRSAQSEHPGRFAVIDLDATGEVPWQALLGSEENQLALREGKVWAPRVRSLADSSGLELPGAPRWQLATTRRGTLDDLEFVDSPRAAKQLDPGEVRVSVRAAGLNFRDVLIALGEYPGEAPIGAEGAGVVLEVGADVVGIAAGDRVMGLIPDSFGPVAVTDSRLLAPIPAGWGFVQAAAVPLAFLTAYYGLVELAGLRRGERLLIHSAAGGVGMAALELARHLEAEVYATASPSKWSILAECGVDPNHIASSRDLAFRDEFLASTDAAGMDVVLDALAREFVDATLQLLPRGGRFIEMGKADIRDPERVASDHPGVQYRAFDLVEAGPAAIGEMLTKILALFHSGAIRVPPIVCFDVRQGVGAFRHVREARHVGKVVLTIPQPVDPNGTVLVTGGTGGVGAVVARHLVRQHGVRELLLASRQGPRGQGARELAAELDDANCSVRIESCDVSDRESLQRLLASIPAERPLTSVIHMAGVLEDRTLALLEPEQLSRVLRPKLDAAIYLHELTADLDLSQFVLFSSVAGTLGSSGQANYAAANAFLDALAQRRCTQGLPAQALAWGPWAIEGDGMAGQLEDAGMARLHRLGVEPIDSALGLDLLDAAKASGHAVLLPIRFQRSGLRAQAEDGMLPPMLRAMAGALGRRDHSGGSLLRQLEQVEDTERGAVVLAEVCGHVAAVLGHASPDEVNPEVSFKELDFDSLDAVELRNRLAHVSGVKLPSTVAFDHPTPTDVARFLCALLSHESSSEPAEVGSL
jgi:NADPH:quinone reductase-like Zn-dependent oxidoreductase/acyl carrier protein